MNFLVDIAARQIVYIGIPDSSSPTVGVNQRKKRVDVEGRRTLKQLRSGTGRIGVNSERITVQLIHSISGSDKVRSNRNMRIGKILDRSRMIHTLDAAPGNKRTSLVNKSETNRHGD